MTPTRQTDQHSDREWLYWTKLLQSKLLPRLKAIRWKEHYPVRENEVWGAGAPNAQIIRLLFDTPQTIRFIRLVLREEQFSRTQEFVLRWLPAQGADWRDIVRQQWNFSPPHTVLECEGLTATMADLRRVSHQSLANEFLC